MIKITEQLTEIEIELKPSYIIAMAESWKRELERLIKATPEIIAEGNEDKIFLVTKLTDKVSIKWWAKFEKGKIVNS